MKVYFKLCLALCSSLLARASASPSSCRNSPGSNSRHSSSRAGRDTITSSERTRHASSWAAAADLSRVWNYF